MNEEMEDSTLFYGNYCVQSTDSERKKKKKKHIEPCPANRIDGTVLGYVR